jgi:hypothetical protein
VEFIARVSVNRGNWYSFSADGTPDVHGVDTLPTISMINVLEMEYGMEYGKERG